MPRKSKSVGEREQDDEPRTRNSKATAVMLVAFVVGTLGNTVGKAYRGVESLADAATALLFVIAAIVARKPTKKLASAAEAPPQDPGKPVRRRRPHDHGTT
jgi:hypothetical protein